MERRQNNQPALRQYADGFSLTMKRNFILGLLLFSLGLPQAVTALAESSTDSVTYRVSVILPLSGKAQSLGNSIRRGIELGYDELPPTEKAKIHLKFEDDASETANALSNYRKAASRSANVVICALSNTGNTLAPLAERDGVVLFSLAVDPRISQGRKNVFVVWALADNLAQPAAAEARRRNYKRIAMVITSHEGNIAMRRAFEDAAQGRFEFPVSEEILPDETDFAPTIMRIKAAKTIDAVANFMHPAQCGLFAKQARDLGLSIPEFSLGNFEDSGALASSAGSLQGQWYTGVQYSEAFIKAFTDKFPNEGFYGASYGYDIITLLGDAARKEIAPQSLSAHLRSVKELSGAARSFSYDEKSERFIFPVAVKVIGQTAK